jgi:nucleoside-diphosphate-sugar epimerase
VSRTVAMTGATGFIGWHVARRFLESGWQVRALVRPESHRVVPAGAERVVASLNEDEIVAACDGASLLVHLAGAVGDRTETEFIRSNVDATVEVARAARRLGVRLVHTSSLGATGPRSPLRPPAEDEPLCPINSYGDSKRRSEEIVKSVEGLEWAIVRPTLVYGPRDRLFLPLFKLARRGLFPIPNRTAAYNVVHVEDVARGFEQVATLATPGETFFLGDPNQVTISTLLEQLASVFDRPFRPMPIPRIGLLAVASIGSLLSACGLHVLLDRARWREIDAEGFVCRVDKARDQLGFVATKDLREGLKETAEWYARAGWM